MRLKAKLPPVLIRVLLVLIGIVLTAFGLVNLGLCVNNYGGIHPFSWSAYFRINQELLLFSLLIVPGVYCLLLARRFGKQSVG